MSFHRQRALRRARGKVGRTWMAVAILTALAAIWTGCSAQKKYQVLSFFFDGVPDPNAPATTNPSELGASGGGANALASSAFVHKPFADKTCQPCHLKEMSIDVFHVRDACISCHQKVEGEFAVMHEPVTAGQCLWCHEPHKSRYAALLITVSSALCIQCHDPMTLPAEPPEHADLKRSCLDCHVAHGAATRQLLRPLPATTQSVAGGEP